MRRIFSLLLVLLAGCAPILEAMPANALRSGWTGKVDESRIPACCRRHGQHHCMMDAMEDDPGLVVMGPSSCPCMPHSMPCTAPTLAALPGNSAVALLRLSRRRALQTIRDAAWTNELRMWPKRGPPQAI
ncbi:hypothetical protein ACFPT7_12400 [Acidicapsa dinghuensis]|uniref:Uncharacterized protein n=1 Tax=Acidicapsa dinghuensis TaxID=2218256 RepID=A0ABW1EJE6_9BACT|nr:hypothetical protein [Acidicapsa dinghuensis]